MRARMRVEEAQQPRHIDDRDHLRAAAGHIDARFVRRNGHAEGLRGIALQLVQRNLHRLAHIRAKERQRIGKCAAVLQMRQRNKILGMILGNHAQPAIGGEGEMEDAGNRVQRHAIDAPRRAPCRSP